LILRKRVAANVATALQSGRLTKSESCETCGRQERNSGHHASYSKPLEIIWLCRRCHDQADDAARAMSPDPRYVGIDWDKVRSNWEVGSQQIVDAYKARNDPAPDLSQIEDEFSLGDALDWAMRLD
jgi:hypothetical protein